MGTSASRDDVSIERIINEAELIRNREDKIGLVMDYDVASRELEKLINLAESQNITR